MDLPILTFDDNLGFHLGKYRWLIADRPFYTILKARNFSSNLRNFYVENTYEQNWSGGCAMITISWPTLLIENARSQFEVKNY